MHLFYRYGLISAFLLATLGFAPWAVAGPITYTFTETVSGTVGSTSFTNAALTWTGIGDTSNYAATGLINTYPFVPFDSDTIAIDSVGVLTPSAAFGFANLSAVYGGTFNVLYFIDSSGKTGTVFDDQDSCTNCDYDMVSNFDGEETSLGFTSIATDQGTLSITSDGPVHFTASTSTVPEPAGLTVMLSGLAMLAAVARRRNGLPSSQA